MELKPEDLASFVTAQSSWIAEAGTYKISIGASSLDVKQSAEFQLNQNIIVKSTTCF
jgi:beta-glucosidase